MRTLRALVFLSVCLVSVVTLDVLLREQGGTAPFREMSFGYEGEIGTASPVKIKEFKTELAGLSRGRAGEMPRSFFEEHYAAYGPEVMLEALSQDKFCHSEAHNLGRVIYARTQDLPMATSICQNSCSAGCIHGVLMEFFASQTDDHPKPEDLSPALAREITHACERSEITRYTGEGNCYHAIGHALAPLGGYNISSSLSLCELLEEKGRGAVYYCATGVYMERDIMLGEEDRGRENLYPCGENSYPAACFRYKLRREFSLPLDYRAAKETCLALEGIERTGCFHGLGFGAAEKVYRTPAALPDLCGGGGEEDELMCIEGALSFISLYDKQVSASACAAYTPKKQILCERAAVVGNFDMGRDFSRYRE